MTSILLCHWWKFWSRDLSWRFSKFYIYEFSYNFNTVLYQFLKIGTSDITFMGHDRELKWLAFSLYRLSFFLYSPFNSFATIMFSVSRLWKSVEVYNLPITREVFDFPSSTELTDFLLLDSPQNHMHFRNHFPF